jgi:cytochrome c oxidase subunit 2
MTTTAWIITIAYAIVVVLGSILGLVVWSSTRQRGTASDEAVEGWSHRERAWLVIVVLGLFALLMATIFYRPYGAHAGHHGQVVRVTGVQFAWAVTPSEVRAGVPVEFLATSEDVSHGFGVYDAGGALQFQAQVGPDETQRIVHTFRRPGTYEVLCLEFCGVDHHRMRTTIEVVE